MPRLSFPTRIAVAAMCLSLTVVSCGSENRYVKTLPGATAGRGGNADLNGDGKVVIMVLSPGNLNDNGYYESFVAKASAFADRQGWQVKRHGEIPADKALAEAKRYCAEDKPDLIALGSEEIGTAIPAASDPVCGGAYWYMQSSSGAEPSKGVLISQDFTYESTIVAGYANALLMQSKGYTKAAMITGPEQLVFTVDAAKAFVAGLRYALPDVKYETIFTADINDGDLAKAAMKKLADEGTQAVYPYLGGGTDPAAKVGNEHDVILSTPGTNRCDSTSPRFDVSVIFDPGEFLAAALQDFANGELRMGTKRQWHIGVDQVPTVRLCNGTDDENAKLAQFIADIGSGSIVVNDQVDKLGKFEVDGRTI